MNIFVTDPDPVISAQALDDKRVRKMLIETAQICSTVLWDKGIEAPYKPTHGRHPCIRWAAADPANLNWTVEHGMALASELYFRFGPEYAHKSIPVMQIINEIANVTRRKPTEFQNSARDLSKGWDYTYMPVPVSYQAYLAMKWSYADVHRPIWTKRGHPKWYDNYEHI